ncbi:trifunctional serine/threonine-protein kinase/ATP-binding protein/sensor histidine kinase [Mangrovibacterium diazotrophicum]|uniref:histidine kinase n=1 Tax=Mangrovibacterium diazotrophicum TaxID=1261403 RepID=A0A419W447_9BACT|nr:ATP-binding sensor histidine kinase [Mangrovibacterium diazotrophicum]RKD90222.1 putative ATPase [Mangrovibacterium diazotrophicum]
MSVAETRIIDHDYRKLRTLFANDRNQIILATREADGVQVVLKQSQLLDGNILLASKLAHEYEILRRLDHPAVPKVHELLTSGNTVTLVQEYVDGIDLRKRVFERRMSIAEVLDIGIQLAEVLLYLHQNQVIHKDINPSNVMLDNSGQLKLLDFGISSNLQSETNDLLSLEQIEGTLAYIAPEQTGRTSFAITQSCDFYSCGILLYELLTGKPPFDSIDPLEVIHFHLSRNPLPISSVVPNLPTGLEQVIFKLLDKNPDERYHNAASLKADLQTIKKHYLNGKPLVEFTAGQNDFVDQYKPSQKLYGREVELAELVEYYESLNELKSILVLVGGYSGVGKSALIRHIKFPIIQRQGTFVSGKFDQFKKDIPYFAFIEAIRDFIRNLLSEPESKIEFWKERISQVLGENAALITEVVPLLSKIIDYQPPVEKLQPAEQENRFNMVLLDFIYAFSTTEHPLVIFLDDLQWADLPSLNLMRRIVQNPRQDQILILGAYRDNEVDKGHPLMITLRQMQDSALRIKKISLQPLKLETTCLIIADSFGMKKDQALELGNHVYQKTKGNPFFIHSFLKTLYDKKLVHRDESNNWVWSQKKIDKLGYTENVVDLMTEGFSTLPDETREVLKYAAVLGSTFPLSELARSTEKSISLVYGVLTPAVKEGFLTTGNKRFRLMALSARHYTPELEKELTSQNLSFSFSHDKVQQAAYNLIAADEMAGVHLRIGRLLLQNKSDSDIEENIFELLNHFVISKHLLEDDEEKKRITELCLIAGRKAKDSTSYGLAVNFLRAGRGMLGKYSWANDYELTFQLLFELGTCEYLNENPDEAEELFKEILGYARTNFEKLNVYYMHSSLYLKMGNTRESLRLGLEAARLYGIRFPQSELGRQLAAMYTLLKYIFLIHTKYRDRDQLAKRPEATDEEMIALNTFMIDLSTSAYQENRYLMMLSVFKVITLYLKYGFSNACGWGFSGFAVVVLEGLKLQKLGFSIWEITQKLNKRTKHPVVKWRLSYTIYCFYAHWRYPRREMLQHIPETLKGCVMNGDNIFTGYTVALIFRYRFALGDELKTLLEESQDHLGLIRNERGGGDFFYPLYQLAKALAGQTKEGTWDDENFNGKAFEQGLLDEGNRTKLGFYQSAKCFLLFYQGQNQEALAQSRVVLEYAENNIGDILIAENSLYIALIISACYAELSESDKKHYRKEFNSHLNNFKYWVEGCRENFIAQQQLLQAEWYALKGDVGTALKEYEKAVATAKKQNLKHVVALTYECAANMCATASLVGQQKMYVQKAWQAYLEWGAALKCRQLEEQFPDWFVKSVTPASTWGAATSTFTGGSTKSALDLASAIKASQSIAEEVKYDGLLKKLMHITIENAGAERGCLLLVKDKKLCVEAVGISGNEGIEILPSLPVSQQNFVPIAVVNYCWRTEESVVIHDAQQEDRFKNDPYIKQQKSASILCLPITALGQLSGLLYLENSLLKGVFDANRIELLQMLSGQIGISIENARLYGNLEEKVRERTREIEMTMAELKATQSQLIQSEKMASLGELTAGIAHEIQNPLNFVNNFSEVSNELMEELHEELEKGDLDEVKAIATDIRQNLEKINHHGTRAASIVRGMLEHSRMGDQKKELTDMVALADEYLRLSYHGLRAKDKNFNAEFKLEAADDIPKIEVVPQDLGRVLLNLMNNAFYAVAEKARQSPEFKPAVTVSLRMANHNLEIEVQDNGNGIPESVKTKIFQPFFTTKPTGQGTGLGLSLSYDIVKAHGGELKVETEEGVGTKFFVQLPKS